MKKQIELKRLNTTVKKGTSAIILTGQDADYIKIIFAGLNQQNELKLTFELSKNMFVEKDNTITER